METKTKREIKSDRATKDTLSLKVERGREGGTKRVTARGWNERKEMTETEREINVQTEW